MELLVLMQIYRVEPSQIFFKLTIGRHAVSMNVTVQYKFHRGAIPSMVKWYYKFFACTNVEPAAWARATVTCSVNFTQPLRNTDCRRYSMKQTCHVISAIDKQVAMPQLNLHMIIFPFREILTCKYNKKVNSLLQLIDQTIFVNKTEYLNDSTRLKNKQ